MNMGSVALVLSSAVLTLACGDNGSSYPGVMRWKCYQFGDRNCICDGLGPGDDFVAGGTDVREVDACPDTLAICQSYFDDGNWQCECRASAFTPDSSATEVKGAPQCPPD